MTLPFTVEQFYGVFRDYNTAVWPAQWILVALAVAALAAVPRPGRGLSVVASAILGLVWAWITLAYHLVFFARISPAAYGFAAFSAARAVTFIWQGVVRRRLTCRWVPGLKAMEGVVLIAFALVVNPVWSAYASHPYPATQTFGLPCPTTIFTIGLLCFAAPPLPRSVVIAPVLWCLVGAQAAFLLGVQSDLGLIAAGLVGLGLLATAGQPHRSSDKVRLLLLTERPSMEQTLDYVTQGNSAQMADAAIVKELKAWIRFNGADAARTRGGLYSVSSGNPNIPSWVGDLAFRWVFIWSKWRHFARLSLAHWA